MRAAIGKALELAGRESEGGRNTMILVPDIVWANKTITIKLRGVYGDIFIRCTTHHSGLKSVAIDTLILVAPDDPAWDIVGEDLARERLYASLEPREYRIR